MALRVRSFREWLDSTPLAGVALDLMREATGSADPVEPLRPLRAAALPSRKRLAFWSLVAGVGASTTAALVAHRSAGAGTPPLLVDLDRWAPSLALRAGIQGATLADALLRPGRELDCVSRWSGVALLPSAPGLHAIFDSARVRDAIASAAGDAPVVLDLGPGADALDPLILASLDRLCVVVGPRGSQLQAAFCATALTAALPCEVSLVTVGASDADAERIAARLPWPHVGAIPSDAYLAADEFGMRAPTMAAVDRLVRACA